MSQSDNTKPESDEPNSVNSIKSLRDEIDSILSATAAVEVHNRLVQYYVETELSEKVSLLKNGFHKLREAKKELQKMKPDMKSHDRDGVVLEQWSNEAWDKKQKAVEALSKLEKALSTALAGKYEDLKKVNCSILAT